MWRCRCSESLSCGSRARRMAATDWCRRSAGQSAAPRAGRRSSRGAWRFRLVSPLGWPVCGAAGEACVAETHNAPCNGSQVVRRRARRSSMYACVSDWCRRSAGQSAAPRASEAGVGEAHNATCCGSRVQGMGLCGWTRADWCRRSAGQSARRGAARGLVSPLGWPVRGAARAGRSGRWQDTQRNLLRVADRIYAGGGLVSPLGWPVRAPRAA